MDEIRCMLVQAKLPMNLWIETLYTTCYLVNLSPFTAIEFKTPLEICSEKPTSYENLKALGCEAYAYISQGKFDPRAFKGVLIGYPDGVKGYKLWCVDFSPLKCIVSRAIVFNKE